MGVEMNEAAPPEGSSWSLLVERREEVIRELINETDRLRRKIRALETEIAMLDQESETHFKWVEEMQNAKRRADQEADSFSEAADHWYKEYKTLQEKNDVLDELNFEHEGLWRAERMLADRLAACLQFGYNNPAEIEAALADYERNRYGEAISD
jgi:chromosome segregation ATPase